MALSGFLRLIEKEIKRRPFADPLRYMYWSGFNALLKNPPYPMNFLRELSFPKGTSATFGEMFFSMVDTRDPKVDEYGKPILDEAFKLLSDIADWMLEHDPRLDDVFRWAFIQLAANRAKLMIESQHYSGLEKHLEDTRNKVGTKWSWIVNQLKTEDRISPVTELHNMPQPYKARIDAILELPALAQDMFSFNGILIRHNFTKELNDKLESALLQRKAYFYLMQDGSLPENSWSLYNSNLHAASGSIKTIVDDSDSLLDIGELLESVRNEEIKNLTALELFLRLNPDNYNAMDIYCEKAARFLPDEELEQKMLIYSRLTHTPPSFEVYSKLNNKDGWSSLASRVIGEELLKLSDCPISNLRNPWLNLSRWEDLGLQKNSIDWYSFFKNSVFWHAPEYYFSQRVSPIPENLFIKYLNQAALKRDWNAVLTACRTRYEFDKKRCRNETILAIWENAEEKMK
jgi:hypothetical protein